LAYDTYLCLMRVTCITLIDTIILNIHTNDAYYYVTPTCGVVDGGVYVLLGHIRVATVGSVAHVDLWYRGGGFNRCVCVCRRGV
jgi:hypothetical protein